MEQVVTMVSLLRELMINHFHFEEVVTSTLMGYLEVVEGTTLCLR